MAVERHILINYLNQLLEIERFTDYCPNGLQVQGKSEIIRIISGVTASQGLIDAAVNHQADLILVHHGYFWRGENPCIVGMKAERVRKLLQHQINLVAYHLPLDAHPVHGNNVQLAKQLGIEIEKTLPIPSAHNPLVWVGNLRQTTDGEQFKKHIAACLERSPLHIPAIDRQIVKLAWCTGAAQDFIDQVVEDPTIDAFLTGEVSERTVHSAREYNIHFFAAGHHATERYGVKQLGNHIAKEFNLWHQFIDSDNPV